MPASTVDITTDQPPNPSHEAVLELVTEMRESPAVLGNRIKEFFDIICLWEELFNPRFDPEERGYEGAIRPTPIKTWQQRWESFDRLSQLSDALLILAEEHYQLEKTNLILDTRNACESLCREMCNGRGKDHFMKGDEEAMHLSKCFSMARPILERLERTHLARSIEFPSRANTEDSGTPAGSSTKATSKRNISAEERGVLVIAHLYDYHVAQDIQEPLGSNRTANQLGISSGALSRWFRENFGSHREYAHTCRRNPDAIKQKLRSLNGEADAFHVSIDSISEQEDLSYGSHGDYASYGGDDDEC